VQVVLHPDARAELRSAALWYEEQGVTGGDEFLAAIAAMLQRISEAPESFPVWTGMRERSPTIRKATIERFPYLIAFELHPAQVLVLAVAHQKRRPLYWHTRASRTTG
jgi:toxin ParE1/3/4